MKRLTVLVVEKEAPLREALRRTLQRRGYEVLVAESRQEGYDVMDEMAPDILILDDPAQERAYRLVWLNGEVPDTRVELVDLETEDLHHQLDDLLDSRFVA
ncbi:MAG: hypothetical protein AB7N76_16380 [Planctomycetota bacterium]